MLEMEPDDFVGDMRVGREPAREPLVELRALALRQGRISRVADEHVAEADDGVIALELDQEPFVNEGKEVVVDVLQPLGPEVRNCLAVELASDDGGSLQE
jgi:hypothetical protein